MPTVKIGVNQSGKIDVTTNSSNVAVLTLSRGSGILGGVVITHGAEGSRGRSVVRYSGGKTWFLDDDEYNIKDKVSFVMPNYTRIGVVT